MGDGGKQACCEAGGQTADFGQTQWDEVLFTGF
ncbi:hypothetical protein EDD95_4897 [Streptomyces sp. CEV 2-1]|nr:hypothetical protein EDD95_4897 [Streptomyces sp. CEV 2-1]